MVESISLLNDVIVNDVLEPILNGPCGELIVRH